MVSMRGLRLEDRLAIVSSFSIPTSVPPCGSDEDVPFLLTEAATNFAYSSASILMRCARHPALNPLLMLTTPTPEAHELSMVRSGATPPKLAP